MLKLLVGIIDMVLIAGCMLLLFKFWRIADPLALNGVSLQIYLAAAVLCYIPVSYMFPAILFDRVVRVDKIVERGVRVVTIYAVLFSSVLFFIKEVAVARWLLLSFFFVFWISHTAFRLILRYSVRRFRMNGRNQQNVILVGQDEELLELNSYMQRREYGYRVYGVFSNSPVSLSTGLVRQGALEDVIPFLEANKHVNAVFCSMSFASKDLLQAIYTYCENHVIRFYALPMYLPNLRKRMIVSQIGSTIILTPRREPLRDAGNRTVKRLFDIVVSLLFLITLYPVIYVVVFIFIKRQSPGPVYFSQKRNGMNGEEFNCLKFRSMHVNAQADTMQATKDDPRKFPFGNLMRRTNIDELPQFLNVLKGDMSLVGPRPHMLLHTEEYGRLINKYMVRHWVKPGITGWAQVNGFRGETKDVSQMEARVKYDIWYIENWTFWLDLRIMWRTAWNMIRRKEENAY